MNSPLPAASAVLFRRIVLSALFACLLPAASATVLYWDANGATAGTGGSGTWNTSGSLWRLGSDAGGLQTWTGANSDANIHEAVFGGTGGTVTIANNAVIYVNRLTFLSGGYSLARGNPQSRLNLTGTNPTIQIGSGLSVTADVVLQGGSLTLTGGGTLQLNRAATYTGATSIVGSTLAYGVSDALASGAVSISGGGVLDLGANRTDTVGTVTLNGGTIAGGGTSALTTTGFFDLREGTVSAILAGAGALTKSGAGTVTLSGQNTYTGTTTVLEGTLRLGASQRISDAGALVVSGGTFDLAGFTETVASITLSGGTIANGTLNGGSFTGESGTMAATVVGSGGLNKVGSGTLTLSGNSTFSGATNIAAGRLQLTGNLTTPSVTVASGAVLSGTGSVSGTVSVSGTLSPGSSPGTLTTGAQTWNPGGSLLFEIDDALGVAGVNWDLLVLQGPLSIAATVGNPFTVQVVGLGWDGVVANFDPLRSYSWTIVNTGGNAVSGFVPGALVIDDTAFAAANPLAGGGFAIVTNDTGLALEFTPQAIPEPSTYALLLGLCTVGLVASRSLWLKRQVRRRKAASSRR